MRFLSLLILAFATPAMPAVVGVTISPTAAEVRLGTTKDFNASVANTTNRAVIWKVNDIVGGNATVGAINGEGLYTPPVAIPAGGRVSIKAVSSADSTKFATAEVTVLNPVPRITELVPYNVNQGLAFSLVVKGTGFKIGRAHV